MTGENGGPLAAKWVARKQVSHDELLTADGFLWWIQSDPDLGGARRLMRASPSGPAQAQTPPGVSVGGWLHAYGGGSFAVAADAQWVDADCAPAPWEGGYRSYAFTDFGQIVLTIHDGIRAELATVDRDGLLLRHATDLTSIKPYVAALGHQVFLIGSTPTSRPSVRVIDLGEPDGTPALPVGPSIGGVPAPATASPPVIRTARSGELSIRYLLHQPDGGFPAPLIVRAHPGPTDDVPLRLDWAVQFFVSRGFAVAEVAYRGSTGQGRAFRQSLHGHWGEYDVEDCATVARQLLESGRVRRDAVFITGASAGGYTALQAACRQGPFTAATATSAIIDPARWEKAVPRFQRPHAAILAGPAGEVRAEAVRVPVLLIHGTADEIAAVDDTRRLSNDLTALGRPHEALFLEGVGHYLSAPAALERALLAELDFYDRLMLREP